MPKDVIRVEDYSSDAAVVKLASLKVTKYLLDLNSTDVSNCFFTIFSLVFLKI